MHTHNICNGSQLQVQMMIKSLTQVHYSSFTNKSLVKTLRELVISYPHTKQQLLQKKHMHHVGESETWALGGSLSSCMCSCILPIPPCNVTISFCWLPLNMALTGQKGKLTTRKTDLFCKSAFIYKYYKTGMLNNLQKAPPHILLLFFPLT